MVEAMLSSFLTEQTVNGFKLPPRMGAQQVLNSMRGPDGKIDLGPVIYETLATGLRRPAIAGLPLLAIFTVPAAILDNGVGWQPFVFGAAGYLALLLAEGRDRITRWGRPVRAQRAPRPASGSAAASTGNRRPNSEARPAAFGAPARSTIVTTQLTQLGRRVGAAAIGVAVVVPVIIPGLHSGWFGTHHTAGAGGLGSDGSGSTSINPIVSMRRDLNQSTPVSLFTYTTTGNPQYLRMITLDKFEFNTVPADAFAIPPAVKALIK